jgi:hypothetical protein
MSEPIVEELEQAAEMQETVNGVPSNAVTTPGSSPANAVLPILNPKPRPVEAVPGIASSIGNTTSIGQGFQDIFAFTDDREHKQPGTIFGGPMRKKAPEGGVTEAEQRAFDEAIAANDRYEEWVEKSVANNFRNKIAQLVVTSNDVLLPGLKHTIQHNLGLEVSQDEIERMEIARDFAANDLPIYELGPVYDYPLALLEELADLLIITGGSTVGAGAGAGVGFLAGGPVGAGAGALKGATVGGLSTAALLETSHAYEHYSQMEDSAGNRLDPKLAARAAVVTGVISAPLEFVGWGKLPKSITAKLGPKQFVDEIIEDVLKDKARRNTIGEFVKGYGSGVVDETATEAFQGAVYVSIGNIAKAYDLNAFEEAELRNVFDGLLEETMKGGESGFQSGAGYSLLEQALGIHLNNRRNRHAGSSHAEPGKANGESPASVPSDTPSSNVDSSTRPETASPNENTRDKRELDPNQQKDAKETADDSGDDLRIFEEGELEKLIDEGIEREEQIVRELEQAENKTPTKDQVDNSSDDLRIFEEGELEKLIDEAIENETVKDRDLTKEEIDALAKEIEEKSDGSEPEVTQEEIDALLKEIESEDEIGTFDRTDKVLNERARDYAREHGKRIQDLTPDEINLIVGQHVKESGEKIPEFSREEIDALLDEYDDDPTAGAPIVDQQESGFVTVPATDDNTGSGRNQRTQSQSNQQDTLAVRHTVENELFVERRLRITPETISLMERIEEINVSRMDIEMIDGLRDVVKESVSTGLSRKKITMMLTEITRNFPNDAQYVRVDVEVIESFIQTNLRHRTMLLEAVPDLDHQINNVRASKGEIKISTAAYLGIFAGTPADEELEDELRLRPGAMTARELLEQQDSIIDELKDHVKRAQAESEDERLVQKLYEEISEGYRPEFDAADTPEKKREVELRAAAHLAALVNLVRRAKVNESTTDEEKDSSGLSEVNSAPAEHQALDSQSNFQTGIHAEGQDFSFSLEVQTGITPKADVPTFMKEMAGLYITVLKHFTQSPRLESEVRDELADILELLNVEFIDEIDEAGQRLLSERFLESVTNTGGTAGGNGQTNGLKGFQSWLADVYRDGGFSQQEGNLLSDETRILLDALSKGSTELSATRGELGLKPIYKDRKSMGLSETDWSAYERTAERSGETAFRQHASASLDRLENRKSREFKKELSGTKKIVRTEVEGSNAFRAKKFLSTGFIQDGLPIQSEHTLDYEAVRAILSRTPDGKNLLKQLPRGKRAITTKSGGKDPDFVAKLAGFSSGESMLRQILPMTRSAVDEYIRVEAMRRVEHQPPGRRRSELHHSVLNPEAEAMVKAEIAAGGGPQSNVASELDRVKRLAKEQSRKTPIAQLTNDSLIPDMRRHHRNAWAAALKGDKKSASSSRLNQMLNVYLSQELSTVQGEADEMIGELRAFTNDEESMNIDGAYLHQINQLMADFGLQDADDGSLEDGRVTVKEATTLEEFIQGQNALGKPVRIDSDVFSDKRGTGTYEALTIDELKSVVDTVRHIGHLGQAAREIRIGDFRMPLNETIAQIDGALKENMPTIDSEKTILEPASIEALSGRTRETRIEQIFKTADGGKNDGPLTGLFLGFAKDAAQKKAAMLKDAYRQVTDVFSVYTRQELNRLIPIPGQNDSALPLETILAMALQWGTESGRSNLVALTADEPSRFDFAEASIEPALRALTKKDWKTIQSVWALMDSYRPAYRELELRTTGLMPSVPSTMTISTRFGRIEGRPFPKSVSGESSLDLGRIIHDRLRGVIHDITHREVLMMYGQLLGSEVVGDALSNHIGIEGTREFVGWLNQSVGQRPTDSKLMPVSDSIGFLQSGSVMGEFARNISRELEAPLGITAVVEQIGAEWIGNGMAAFFNAQAVSEENNILEQIQNRSSYVRSYIESINRHISDTIEMKQKDGRIDVVELSMLWMNQKAEIMKGGSAWLGAYNHSLTDGNSDTRAVAAADKALRKIVGKDRLHSPMVGARSGEWFRTFYAAFESGFQQANGEFDPLELAKMVSDVLTTAIVPTLFTEAIVNGGIKSGETMQDWAIDNGFDAFLGLKTGLGRDADEATNINDSMRGLFSQLTLGDEGDGGENRLRQIDVDDVSLTSSAHYPGEFVFQMLRGISDAEANAFGLLSGAAANR